MEMPALAALLERDDSALFAWRHEARDELERNPSAALQRLYDQTTAEVTERAAVSWGLAPQPPR
jgi:hypothetical protein